MISHLKNELRQKESGRRLFLLAGVVALAAPFTRSSARADDSASSGGADAGGLDSGGLTFKDFGSPDNGASFGRTNPALSSGSESTTARVVTIDTANGLARVYFNSVKVEASVPLGWQATEDSERGMAFSADQKTRFLVWRVDFTYEGVRDAEHYAATKMGAIKSRNPNVRTEARKLADGTFLIVYENAPASRGDNSPRTVFDIVTPKPGNPKQGVLMTLGVPAADADRGLRLLALLKSKVVITW
jgi:hypothetical protein